jgi:hypothetical protein
MLWALASFAMVPIALGGCGGEAMPSPVEDGGADTDSAEVAVDAGGDGAQDIGGDAEIPAPPIAVGPLRWNAAGAMTGSVAALAEQGDTLFLFGSLGLQVFAGGAVSAMDAASTMWRMAAVIPAGDGGGGEWVAAVDANGRVWRVRNRSALEEVTGRYALMMRDARSVARLSMNRVAFGLAGGIAVADGTQVRVWSDGSFASLVGSGSRVAARTAAGVRVFDVDATRFVDYALAGVTGVALDARARLVVTTAGAIYSENDRGELVFRRRSAAALRDVVQSGERTWLVAGEGLALWDGDDLRPATDVRVPEGARILPSSSGDVWLLAGGALTRFSVLASPDLQRWIETVRPVFARRCTPCHLPEGTGNRDLTTYAAWVMHRGLIRGRVLTDMDMPPPPSALQPMEREALAQWLESPPIDGGGIDGGSADVTADTAPEAGRDATVDAPRDAAVDAPRDAAVDAPRDATVDAPRDAVGDVAADAAAVRYAAVDTIFQASCVRCHGTSGGLNLSNPMTAYGALVGVAAGGATCAGGGRVRVVAGDPMASLLYLKLVNMQTCGNAMPRGGTLTAAQVETVRRWIAGGALR